MDYLKLINHLEVRLQKNEAFLFARQDQLAVDDPEQKEIYEVTQGKIDMCQQVLGYLERLRKNPAMIEAFS